MNSTKQGERSPTLGRSVKHVWACEKWIIEALHTTSGWDLMLLLVINENIPKPGPETSALTQVWGREDSSRRQPWENGWFQKMNALQLAVDWHSRMVSNQREMPFKMWRASSTLVEIRESVGV